MRTLSFALILITALCAPNRVHGKASEPNYILLNHLSEAIKVEFVSTTGKSLGAKMIKPGQELSLRVSRRIVIRTATRAYEYALPAVLDVPISVRGVAQKYESMINGKWRVIVSEATTLGIEFIGGGTVEQVPDFAKPPLLFPLRPRKQSETFDQYKDALRAQTRAALVK